MNAVAKESAYRTSKVTWGDTHDTVRRDGAAVTSLSQSRFSLTRLIRQFANMMLLEVGTTLKREHRIVEARGIRLVVDRSNSLFRKHYPALI